MCVIGTAMPVQLRFSVRLFLVLVAELADTIGFYHFVQNFEVIEPCFWTQYLGLFFIYLSI